MHTHRGFCDIFGQIGGCATPVEVFALETMLLGTGFCCILLQRITLYDVKHCLTLHLWSEHHQMPVRRAVMMRLNHSHTVDLQTAILEGGSHFPHWATR